MISLPSIPSSRPPSVHSDRFEVGCEGEPIEAFPDAATALQFARWSAEITGCSHEIFDAHTHTALCIVDPLEAA